MVFLLALSLPQKVFYERTRSYSQDVRDQISGRIIESEATPSLRKVFLSVRTRVVRSSIHVVSSKEQQGCGPPHNRKIYASSEKSLCPPQCSMFIFLTRNTTNMAVNTNTIIASVQKCYSERKKVPVVRGAALATAAASSRTCYPRSTKLHYGKSLLWPNEGASYSIFCWKWSLWVVKAQPNVCSWCKLSPVEAMN